MAHEDTNAEKPKATEKNERKLYEQPSWTGETVFEKTALACNDAVSPCAVSS